MVASFHVPKQKKIGLSESQSDANSLKLAVSAFPILWLRVKFMAQRLCYERRSIN